MDTNPENFRRSPWQVAMDDDRWGDAMSLWIAERTADGTFVQETGRYERQRAFLAMARYLGARE